MAAASPAWNVTTTRRGVLCGEVGSVDENLWQQALRTLLLRPVKRPAHTGGEYSAANEYAIATRGEMRQAAPS